MMNDPRELYRLTAVPGQPGPVLISLSGFMDGGQAGQLAVQHLIEPSGECHRTTSTSTS